MNTDNRSLAGESVTIQITQENHYEWNNINPFNISGIIKIKGQKRFCFQIRNTGKSEYEYNISMVLVYNPSPKSSLHNKSIFSKIKYRIV